MSWHRVTRTYKVKKRIQRLSGGPYSGQRALMAISSNTLTFKVGDYHGYYASGVWVSESE